MTDNVTDSSPIFPFQPGRCWLVKFAPWRTSWEQIVMRGQFTLRGVRSPAARKNLATMKQGDAVYFYRSQECQAVMGLMEVTREAYPDPTSADPQWLTCDFAPVATLAQPVTLDSIKAVEALSDMALVKQPRLAVMPVTADQAAMIWVEGQ